MSAALPATAPATEGGPVAACSCGGTELGPSAYATARGGERFGLRPCLRCGRLVLDPRPDDAALAAAYDRAYYGIGARKFLQPIESGLDRFRGGRARRLDALVPDDGRAHAPGPRHRLRRRRLPGGTRGAGMGLPWQRAQPADRAARRRPHRPADPHGCPRPRRVRSRLARRRQHLARARAPARSRPRPRGLRALAGPRRPAARGRAERRIVAGARLRGPLVPPRPAVPPAPLRPVVPGAHPVRSRVRGGGGESLLLAVQPLRRAAEPAERARASGATSCTTC